MYIFIYTYQEIQMANKFGNYINKLMTTVLDKEQDEFVKDLSLSELKNINLKIEEFLHKHTRDDEEQSEKTIKTLLQEEKDNG